MTQADIKVRPGGLTALAVLNFVIGGITAMGLLFSLLSFGCTVSIQGAEQARDLASRLMDIAFGAVLALSLLLSGAALVRVKKMPALIFSNLYAAAAVAKVFVKSSRGPSMFTIFALVYPVLLFFMINFVFRDLWRKAALPAKGAGDTEAAGIDMKIPHFLLVFQSSLRQLWRGATGVLLTLIVMAAGLGTAQAVFFPVELLGRQTGLLGQLTGGDQEGAVRMVEKTAVPFLGRLLSRLTEPLAAGAGAGDVQQGNTGREIIPRIGGNSEEFLPPSFRGEDTAPANSGERWAYYLLRERPGFLSFLLILFISLLPPLLVFSVFNQISQEAGTKGFRYILMRTGRGQIFFGKYLGSLLSIFIMLFILFVSVILYMQLKLRLYDTLRVVSWGFSGFLRFFLLSIPVAALGILFSSLTNSGIGALGLGIGSLVLIPGFGSIFSRFWQPVQFIGFLLPTRAAYFMFHPEWWVSLLASLGMFVYGGVYLYLGYLHFMRRDL